MKPPFVFEDPYRDSSDAYEDHLNEVIYTINVKIDERLEDLFKEAFNAGMKYEDDLEVDFDAWFAAFIERLKNE